MGIGLAEAIDEDMAYVLGFVQADGNISPKPCEIRYFNENKVLFDRVSEVADRFARRFDARLTTRWEESSGVWVGQVSKCDLVRLLLHPRKPPRVSWAYKPVIHSILATNPSLAERFVAGAWDGDGAVRYRPTARSISILVG